MVERDSPYKQVSLEDAVTDSQTRDDIRGLNKPWEPQKARFQMAGYLAVGLLILFGLTIVCNGFIVTTLIVASALSDHLDPSNGVKQITDFVAMILPYIATPLGVALGFFVKESRDESP